MDEGVGGWPRASGGASRRIHWTQEDWGQDPQGQPEPRVVPALGAVGRMGFRGYWVMGTMLLT